MPTAGQTAMATSSPYRVVLTDEDRRVLTRRARSHRRPHRDVQRAAIVLAAVEETTNAEIARRLGICCDTVRKWRGPVCAGGVAGGVARAGAGRRGPLPPP